MKRLTVTRHDQEHAHAALQKTSQQVSKAGGCDVHLRIRPRACSHVHRHFQRRPDTGANTVQNFPELLSASQNGNQLTVTYRVDTATTNAMYPLRIDFHEDVQGGSGASLAEDMYPSASAQQARTVTLTLPDAVKAIPLVATATDAGGRSSDFSPAPDVIFEDDFE